MARRTQDFQAIRSEGGLLPADLLRRVLDPRSKLEGIRPEDYGLLENDRLNEVITQSWARLRKHWSEFRAAAVGLPEGEAGTGLTNDKWNLPLMRELGFGFMQAGAGREVDGRTYAISRFFGPVPVHLIGCGLSLDHRAAGQRGAAAINPHGLVQEFLNRSPDHVWAVLSNGLRLRILRDNQALSRQSFLEFDLEIIFTGEVYSDFVILWLMTHATRFSPREEGRPETCWLEKWAKEAEEQGTRALGDLRKGVERALLILGEGFTSHQKNTSLRDALRTGNLLPSDFHGQLLRVVYRLIFLFVAEDRSLEGQSMLHPADDSDAARAARECYAAYYSSTRLRELAGKIKGSRHSDFWRQFQISMRALSGDVDSGQIREQLALPALGSLLWDPASTQALNDAELTNHDFLEALRFLAFTRQGKILRPVDYKNLGAEELGGVYESLLALTPQISGDGARFTFADFSGNERKTSGSYYTPDSLVQCLLDSALDPVVEEAIRGKKGPETEKAILDLKICDPAVGSGHFLVGAAHRLARHLARVRALAHGESEPSPLIYQHALRDVIGRCLYGVDINPMAAELCRVSLWLEALEPGKPLSFLDHHIRIGNSLLGATPELIAIGLPDEAFIAIEGDDKKACAELKKRNKDIRREIGPLFSQQDAETQAHLQLIAAALDEMPDNLPEDIHAKEQALLHQEQSEEYRLKKRLADAWCAAFVIKKYQRDPGRISSAFGITQGSLNDLAAGIPLPAELASIVERLLFQYQFFHWHLVFPEVFAKGGFNCVLGNPPWERVKLQEKEWFAERCPKIANTPNASARKRMIESLKAEDPIVYDQFLNDLRKAEGESHFIRNCKRYALCGRGDINLYAVFAEGMRDLLNNKGRLGCVLPTGIATDDTTKFFFQDVVKKKSLASLFDFDNGKAIFPGVQGNIKFCLFTLATLEVEEFEIAAQLDDPQLLYEPARRYRLTGNDIRVLNPNTLNCPTFRLASDALLVTSIHRRHPILISESDDVIGNRWHINFNSMFHMTNDSSFFKTLEELNEMGATRDGNIYRTTRDAYFPLYEAKLVYQFNHRSATFEGIPAANRFKIHAGTSTATQPELLDPNWTPLPRFWISEQELRRRCDEDTRFLFGFRNAISATADSRSLISSILPRCGVGNSLPLFNTQYGASSAAILMAAFNSFIMDYVLRQKASGGNLNFYILKQMPVLDPEIIQKTTIWGDTRGILQKWLMPRILELSYTAWDLESFAQSCGWPGPPFRWDDERRFLLRCELDAAFFHLYLGSKNEWNQQPTTLTQFFPIPRDAVVYIMDTFPIVKRKDEKRYGDYRTKHTILEFYDAMQESIRTGLPYQTRLSPPPADPRCCHPPREAYRS